MSEIIKASHMNLKKVCAIVALALIAVFAISCLHKSVTKGTADDVEKAVILTQGNKKYLIAYEMVYQAISKSSNQGFTTIRGYNDSRVSCYDLSTGALVARQPMGRYGEDKAATFLGLTPGNLWFYSVESKKGLFSLDPLTLAPKITQQQIFTANPSLDGHLSIPKWYETEKYFLTDPAGQRVQLTDDQGFRYLLDPATLKAERVGDSLFYPVYSFDPFLASGVSLNENTSIQLSGDIREKFEINYKKTADTLAFLGGRFIIRQEPAELRIHDPHKEIPLQPDSAGFFVAHKSSTAKDARLMISRVQYDGAGSFTVRWTLKLEDIFYDASAAKETDAFKRVFSKGDPEFGFQFFTLEDDLLVGIYMLRTFAVDVNTGKLKWMNNGI